ncbi:hypothetical protein AB0C96_32530 [Streptomyces sp. NPDC048506]|uniref:hypothetical protein n=1 Tax=Streptomyces sp. NPDC048506 TaxID=3155028 RepID=UPI003419AD4D
MVSGTAQENSPQRLLEAWFGDLPYRLLLLQTTLFGEETPSFPLDYSAGSLDELEARLLARHDSIQDPEEWAESVERATAYLGEVLLGVAGGAWGWNARPVDDLPGQPVVRPDPELQLSPVAPRLLICYALRVRTGTAFAGEVARLRRAVAARQREVPGWEPVKDPTPHVDPTAPLPEDPVLTAWLDERETAHPDWAEDALDGAWRRSFHPDTLGRLEAAVRQRFATAAEFDAAQDEPFVQGACWYLGEVIRRNRGAVWQYIPFDPDAEPGAPGSWENVWTGVPFVDQPDKRLGGMAIPLGCLRELLLPEEADGQPQDGEDRLRDVLIWFRASSYAHVGALLKRMGMVTREKVEEVLAECAALAHRELLPHEVASALEEFGVAISAHGDDVDELEGSYAAILEEAAALTGGAVTITDLRLRPDEERGGVLEFARNGVPVTLWAEHASGDYLDLLAVMECIGHVDPDPGDDPRRFHLVEFVRLVETTFDTYFVYATPEQATVLEKELGLDLR